MPKTKAYRNIRYSVSVAIKLLIIVISAAGLFSRLAENTTLILYFTLQSNIWLAVVSAILVVVMLRRRTELSFCMSKKLTLLQLVFTVSITLTGCVYCIVLVPSFIADGSKSAASVFAFDQLCLHIFTPLLAIADLLFFTPVSFVPYKKAVLSVLPPLFYVFFSLVGFMLKWDFGDGKNYPYFFLNHGSSAGVIGFSSQMPYFMGTLYWIILLGVFIIGIAMLYIKVINKKCKQK